MAEATHRVEHVATAVEVRANQKNQYFRIPEWDNAPSGRLKLTLGHSGYGETFLAADRERWTLDDRLPYVLAMLEERAAAAEEVRMQAERKRLEHRAAWERAKTHIIEHHRATWPAEPLAARQRALQARAFVAEARIATEVSDEDRAWLDWVEDYADRIDPVGKPLAPPPAPEPTADKLKPFLTGFSFWEPE